MIELNIAREIIEVCQRLNQKNYLASADGNVSFRFSSSRIVITPTGINKAFLKPNDLAEIDLDNNILSGKPSGERLMHLQIFRACPKAKCIVHAHPPTAIAWSVARPDLRELPADALSEVILAVGSIPIVPYARPGTQAMGDVLSPILCSNRVAILARHGAISWGESIMEAYNGMERLEHSAQILMNAHLLGGISRLPENEVRHLRAMRTQLGERIL